MIQLRFLQKLISPDSQSERENIIKAFQSASDRFHVLIRNMIVSFRDVNGPRGGIDQSCTVHVNLHSGTRVVAAGKGVSVLHAAYVAAENMKVRLAKIASRKSSKARNAALT